MNLYGFYPDSSTYTLDGTLTRYADSYYDAIDINDSRKMYNSGENISLRRGAIDLIVECRQTIGTTDTIFFRMWGMQKKSYRMEFIARNLDHPGLQGYLEDSYLHTSSAIQLNDTTRFTITINNDPGSYAQNRFRVIFNTPSPVAPVQHYTTVQATQMNSNIFISWNTLNQNNIKQYFIEKSSDGSHFSTVATIPGVNGAGIYKWTDHYPAELLNYYRIKEETMQGSIDYTPVITVKSAIFKGITLYPNPATASNLNIRFADQKPGTYEIMLMNSAGHIISRETYVYPGGTGVKKLAVNADVPAGVYRIEISDGDVNRFVMGVVL